MEFFGFQVVDHRTRNPREIDPPNQYFHPILQAALNASRHASESPLPFSSADPPLPFGRRGGLGDAAHDQFRGGRVTRTTGLARRTMDGSSWDGSFFVGGGGAMPGGGGVILFSSRLGVFFSWHGEEVFCFCNLFTVFLIKQIQVGWFGLRTREIFRHKTQGIWKFLLAETSVFTSFLLMLPGLLSWSFSPNGVAVAVQKVAATAVAVVVEVRSSRSGGGGIGSGRGSGGR